jgi:hypothetical protein
MTIKPTPNDYRMACELNAAFDRGHYNYWPEGYEDTSESKHSAPTGDYPEDMPVIYSGTL